MLLAALVCALPASAHPAQGLEPIGDQPVDETAKRRQILPHIADREGVAISGAGHQRDAESDPVHAAIVPSFHQPVRDLERGEGIGFERDLPAARKRWSSGLEHPERPHVGGGVGIRDAGLLGAGGCPGGVCIGRAIGHADGHGDGAELPGGDGVSVSGADAGGQRGHGDRKQYHPGSLLPPYP